MEFSHPFPVGFSASKVVITHPFLIRPLISWVGEYLQICMKISHRVITKSCRKTRKILLARWTFHQKKVFNGCDYQGFMDVASSSFSFFSFFWLRQLVLWRSRRKFFTKSEKSFLEDASKNVIIEVSRCNLCYPCFFVGGRAGSTISTLLHGKSTLKIDR